MLHLSARRFCFVTCFSLLLCMSATPWAESISVSFGDTGEGSPSSFFAKLEEGELAVGSLLFEIQERLFRVRGGEEKELSFAPQHADCIHFLHFTENAGDRLGSYVLVYEDGSQEEVPLQNGISIQDWWKPGPLAFAAEAFRDTLGAEHNGQNIAFWRFSLRNPHPERALSALRAAVHDPTVILNVLAISLDTSCPEKIDGFPSWVVGMDEESYILALLSQADKTGDEAKFCARLGQIGSRESTPVLGEHLLMEDSSAGAAMALAAMPYEEARDALRQALTQTQGVMKAQVIESLGTLQQEKDSPLLLPFLEEEDALIRQTTATALGKIGGSNAIDALWAWAEEREGSETAHCQHALLASLDKLSRSRRKEAHQGYQQFLDTWPEDTTTAAAWRGLLLTATSRAKPLLTQALTQDNSLAWQGALAAVPSMKGKGITDHVVQLAEQLEDTKTALLVAALGERKDAAAQPFLLSLLDGDNTLLVQAALDALSSMADAKAIPALIRQAARSDGSTADKALQYLAQMKDGKTAPTLVHYLSKADATETAVVAEVLGQRQEKEVAPSLRQLLLHKDSAVRSAAARALARVGEAEDAALLCEAWQEAETPEEDTVFFEALQVLAKGDINNTTYLQTLKGIYVEADTSQRLRLLPLFARLGHSESVTLLSEAVAQGNEAEAEAARKAFTQIRNAAALSPILDLIRADRHEKERLPLFRNMARLLQQEEVSDSEREVFLTAGFEEARNLQEKRLLLSALNHGTSLEALALARTCFAESGLEAEAAVAWGSIALRLVESHRQEIAAAFPDLFEAAREVPLSENAMQPLHALRKVLNAQATAGSTLHFEEILIDPVFRSEGIAVADINRDGIQDVVVGDFWYEAPHWAAHEIRPPGSFEPLTEYSAAFAVFAEDVDRDGWIDVIVVGFPGAPVYWYRNPGREEGHWQEYLIALEACGETVLYEDVTGDGKRELIFAVNKRMTWLTPGQDVTAPWIAHPFTHQLESFALFGHGLGVGDLNGDGRQDVLITAGWWAGPEEPKRPDWSFYPAILGPDCAHMVVCDVNNDGLMDVMSSSAHDYGLWWFEQQPSTEGPPTFVRHEIDSSCASTHALILADLNHDGLPDLITGKRFYAHGKEDPGALEPALLCWYELSRDDHDSPSWKRHIIHKDSGVGTQFEVCDIDGDGLPDIAVSSKKGVRLFLQRRSSAQ